VALTIERGIFQSFNSATYTATVLLLEATSATLTNVPIATHIDGTSAQVGALCAVLFFDEQNYSDAVIIAIYPNSSLGVPTPPPGRVVFVTGYQQVNAAALTSGSTYTYTLTGAGGIPSGALGVIYKAYFTSPSVGASMTLCPHGAADNNAYGSIGNIQVANQYANTTGVLQVDASGKIDVKPTGGNATFTLYTHGYVF
jgi:hypothetical protein